MTDQGMKKLVANLIAAQAEMERQLVSVSWELGRVANRLNDLFPRADRGTEELMKVLHNQFGMRDFSQGAQMYRKDRKLVIGVLAYSAGKPKHAFVVKYCEDLTAKSIREVKKTATDLLKFNPVRSDHTVFALLAATHISDPAQRQAIKEGIYFGQMTDETFTLCVPDHFVPRGFTLKGKSAKRPNAKKK